MPRQKRSPQPLYKKPAFWVIISLALIAIVTGAFMWHSDKNASNTASNPVNTVNYNPPTQQEKEATDEFKKQQQEQAEQNPKPSTGAKSVTPVISYAGQYDASIEASAYVPGIFEDGGSCTLTLTKGSKTVTKTESAVKDATTTRCMLFSFAAKEVPEKGTWSATVTYTSATASGTSKSMEFEVK